MKTIERSRPLAAETTHDLIQEIRAREQERFAIAMLRSYMPWWRARFQISDRIWGLSHWLCFCPWNGDTAWVQLPFLYFGAGTMNIELRLGGATYGVTFDIRWRWA